MLPPEEFPEDLVQEFVSIHTEWLAICNDWQLFNDETIPEDKIFGVRIIKFYIAVAEFIKRNWDGIDRNKYQDFLSYYYYEFFYGPNGDDRNYLDFDEKIDGEIIHDFFWDLRDDDASMTKEELEIILKKLQRLLQALS